MKKVSKLLFNRLFIVGLALVIELSWIYMVLLMLSSYSIYVTMAMNVVSFLAVLWVVNKRINPYYKLAWTILIMLIPLFGVVLYIIFGKSRVARVTQKQFDKYTDKYNSHLLPSPYVLDELEHLDKRVANQAYYLTHTAHAPIYTKTETQYFPLGEDLYKKLMEELKAAEHFIFMEYFIIDTGEMWNSVLEVLEQKVKEGLDVRLIYDDMGCVTTLPAKFYKTLQAKGIKCAAFNPVRPILSVLLNNRDHRKITVIDGHTSFTGGINLADEYINKKKKYGHWKDTGIMLKGEAVWNFTMMFLQMWNVITKTDSDFVKYKPHVYFADEFMDDGFVQPYGDSPLDYETVGENVYLNLINKAKEYVYIFTPYLIIDNEMMSALCLAAKSGIDVRIVTPAIPDKKLVFMLTRSYYSQLTDAGVKIYEYNPGFIHAKSFVCDDETAVIGTINMDYRSLYLHFECGVFVYKSNAVMQLKDDVIKTLEKSTLITKDFINTQKLPVRGMQSILRLFAPML